MSEGDSKTFNHKTGEHVEGNRPLSVSFSREADEINFKSEVCGDSSNEDDIQISLAPYIQVYLAHSSKRVECCGISLPVPFERAARRSWWDPRFDSEILEGQYRLSAFPQIRLRFRYSLIYIFMVSLSWSFYLICKSFLWFTDNESYRVGITFGVFSLFTLFILLFTQSNLYRRFHLPVSIMTSILMFALSLVSVGTISVLTPVGDFSLCIEILMIMYTVIPLPLYMCVILGVCYSVLFEILIGSPFALTPRILCHICVHLIGVHILVMTNVRMRGTFMKVGQSLLVRRQLEMEKQLKEKMIHSVMPPKVADWLMSEGANNGRESEDGKHPSLHNEGDIKSLFRPFNMHRMEDVSILFADIVGFTKMSSTKTAEQLVSILNDLFERFDDLCAANGCEKISTLGDCYYCVSGCPEPRHDHAVCCVEMGLGMIRAIAEFDKESNEGVNMRVGIHTGTVLCGIVGTRRVKFDVWSNDVTLANRMESTGRPGQVHLSENTRKFLGDDYILEEGDVINDIKTYFVKDRPSTFSSNQSTLALPVIELSPSPSLQNNRRSSISLATAISIHINQTAVLEEVLNNSRSPPPRTPSPSDIGHNGIDTLSSPTLYDRNRLSPHPEMIRSNSNPVSPMHLVAPLQRSRSPVRRILRGVAEENWKATSLPSILDSENGEHTEVNPVEENSVLSRRSLAISGVFSNKPIAPKWKYLKLSTEEAKSDAGVGTGVNRVQCQSEPQSPTSEKSECQLEIPREDETSVCLSVNSRKDSGIRSNSRRSSIQHQLFVMNGLTQSEQHRVSGYYTSSQSSVNNEDSLKGSKLPAPPVADNFGVSFQKLRKQSDLQLIKCVQDNSASQRSYFVKPPLSGFSLFFRQKELEREYRQKAHRAQEDGATTLAAARFNTYLDIAVALAVFVLLMTSSLLMYSLSYVWLLVFFSLCLLQVITLVLCVRSMFFPRLESQLERFSSWYPWHFIGGILVSLPVVGVLISFCDSLGVQDGIYHFAVMLFIGLIHFCNFTQLNCWMKSTFASVTGLVYLILISTQLPYDINISQSVDQNASDFKINDSVPLNIPSDWTNILNLSEINSGFDSKHSSEIVPELPIVPNQSNFTHNVLKREIEHADIFFNIGILNFTVHSLESDNDERMSNGFYVEIYLDVLLLLLLVWFLNREFEISYRLSFHGNAVAARDKAKVQAMKDQADWLLHNIIPRHVAEHLKNTAKYSENVKNAGIIFASIINFSEMYDESYLGGKECLRVLNELVSDFDELLSRPQFASVEKIKTIGSTFMAASGLNPSMRNRPDSEQHLFDLMEFAMSLQDVVEAFNRDLLEFNLILRIGYNYGDVTAGVIGTTKLYYDIWGDAVNIASRMDSTGVPCRIQVPANCLHVLSQRYDFEPRGQVYVKGKDHMNVYLTIGRKQNT